MERLEAVVAPDSGRASEVRATIASGLGEWGLQADGGTSEHESGKMGSLEPV